MIQEDFDMQNMNVASHSKAFLCVILSVTALLLCACDSRSDGTYYIKNATFAGYDLAADKGITFTDSLIDRNEPEKDSPILSTPSDPTPNETDTVGSFYMRVYKDMDIFNNIGDKIPVSTLIPGTLISIEEIENNVWVSVSTMEGKHIGYAKDGFLKATDNDCAVYAELPVEYGLAKTNDESYVAAYSHLVDIRRYLKVYETQRPSDIKKINPADYDVIVCMQLSTNNTSIKEPFYQRNLCLVQYDLIPKIMEAVKLFRDDGYTIVIYDAYRPTSVQQRWFDVVRVHKWVADPSRGMGGIHDRGTALDMSLVGRDGVLLEMPTAMHTFTDEASRLSETMTDTARENMDYMKDVMVSCGFAYINSEWWHFQDVNTKYYLPTDHPLDEIPLVSAVK